MLDVRSKIILKFLVKECSEGSYKIIDVADIIAILPKKFKADSEVIIQAIKHLENGGYISVKYSDDEQFCLCPMPFGRQVVENELTKMSIKNGFVGISQTAYILIFVFAFLGAFLGTIIVSLVNIV